MVIQCTNEGGKYLHEQCITTKIYSLEWLVHDHHAMNMTIELSLEDPHMKVDNFLNLESLAICINEFLKT